MIRYTIKSFEQLDGSELYEILALRQEVFIVEQNCPYQDADGKDFDSYHVIGREENGQIVAYARLVKLGVSYDDYISIGRVITSAVIRRTGEGYRLMEVAINAIQELWGNIDIKISAQTHLVPFYTNTGFISTGEEYLEDDIPHTAMIFKVKKKT